MKERERTCCFTGHRIIPAQVVPQLKAELAQTVTQLIDQGVTQFVTGGGSAASAEGAPGHPPAPDDAL